MKRRHKTLTLVVCMAVVAALAVAGFRYGPMLSSANKGAHEARIFIRRGDTQADVEAKLTRVLYGDISIFRQLVEWHGYTVHAGRYLIPPGTSWLRVYQRLAMGDQDEVDIEARVGRDLERWCAETTSSLALSHDSLYHLLTDSAALQPLGFTPQTVMAMLIPHRYRLPWDTPLDSFVVMLKQTYDDFWTPRRLRQAEHMGMTPVEVATLASIVEQETHFDDERARVAGVYVNRLHEGMRLQSDPTVIFAHRAWGVNRMTADMLRIRSPYNTYRVEGLPPGPISLASEASLDAVLHYERHAYMYFVAAADFSGHHVFARTYEEHQRNAQAYIEALERRGVN